MRRMNFKRAILWIGLSLLTGFAGSIASLDAATFYAQLVRPSWAPPAFLFGPVWTALYLMMGIAAFLVSRSGHEGARRALTLFAAHLPVNALWSWLFFYFKSGAGSLACIIVLWLMIVTLVVLFARIRPAASALLLPYLGWVTFATALNYRIWQRNPTLL
jgi:tryptophan-rich sensory protein